LYTRRMKKADIKFELNSPMEFYDRLDQDGCTLREEEQVIVDRVGAAVKAYLNAAQDALNGKYAHLKEYAPTHLAQPGNVLAVCCPDGVVVRYERRTDQMRIFIGWMSDSIATVASQLSQNVIHCYANRGYTSTVHETGALLEMWAEDGITGQRDVVVSGRIGIEAVLERPEKIPQPPRKPFCLLSVRSALEVNVLCELVPKESSGQTGQRFLTRSFVSLGVGWECIEVFPFVNVEHWNSDYAALWAETDLLAAVAAEQFRAEQFQSLDPKASARNQYAELLRDYRSLLDSEPSREEVLQVFLRDHPVLLCPTQTQMWPKLPLGARETDFVFRQASGDYLLVELERSTLSLFRKDGHASAHLNHAHGQVVDWKRYLEDNLSTVQRELGLTGISSNPQSLIVIGRSQSLSSANRRKLVTIENESPKLKIMTYDDVYDNTTALVENLLGPILHTGATTQIFFLQNDSS
jgi:hypothetical protein